MDTTLGPVVGAVVLRLLEEVARHFVGGVGYQVVYGAVIILFIVGMPEGLVGFVRHLLRKRQRAVAPPKPRLAS
jgi:branched-chain amino acid transport system permease protein